MIPALVWAIGAAIQRNGIRNFRHLKSPACARIDQRALNPPAYPHAAVEGYMIANSSLN
jgi:hypothetical protein